jgi:hypothetical protein
MDRVTGLLGHELGRLKCTQIFNKLDLMLVPSIGLHFHAWLSRGGCKGWLGMSWRALAALLFLLQHAAPSCSFVSHHMGLHQTGLRVPPFLSLRRSHLPASCKARISPGSWLRTGTCRVGARTHGVALLSAMSELVLPANPSALQEQLWQLADVLPDMEETQVFPRVSFSDSLALAAARSGKDADTLYTSCAWTRHRIQA